MTSSAMSSLLSAAEAIGAASLAGFWGPVAAWTVVAAAALVVGDRWGARAPAVAYRGTQAVLFALPLGVALALVLDPTWLPTLRDAPALAVLPDPAFAALPAPAAGLAPEAPVATVAWGHVLAGVLTAVAGVAALGGLVRLGAQSLRLRQLRQSLPIVAADGLDEDAWAALGRIGPCRMPQVIVTSADVVPMTLGVRRPLVVVPASLGRADRRLALAHEFAHVRQADPLAHAAEAVTAALFRVHPLAARLARQCDLYREMTCDAAVLAHAATDRRAYATLVSSFATHAHRWSAPALGMAARQPHVHQRILAMTQPRLTSRFAAPLSLALLATAVVTVMAGSAVAQPARIIDSEGTQVVFVDGERVEGQLDDLDLDALDVYSINVNQQRRGRLGRPDRDPGRGRGSGPALEARRRRPLDPPSASITVRTEGVDASGVEVSQEVRLAEGRASRDALVADLDEARVEVEVEEPAEGARRGLVFVDGVRSDWSAIEATDPSSIESIEVMRGEAATAAYGPAGADGVILVTTKAASAAALQALAAAQAEQAAEGFSIGNARPNPATGEVRVPFSLGQAQNVRAQVYDLTGRLVLEQDRPMPAGTSSMTFDLSGLAPGVYTVRATGLVDGQRVLAQQRFTVVR